IREKENFGIPKIKEQTKANGQNMNEKTNNQRKEEKAILVILQAPVAKTQG
ncbi:MAG: hypothetical protein F6K35_18585, partial [Okeania sp. SIO2H7]|nr:hypothetical protein [Okeania sp. SIO2H7]